jgi:hypothetical protein
VDDEAEQDACLEAVGNAALGLSLRDLGGFAACARYRECVRRVFAAFQALPGDEAGDVLGVAIAARRSPAGRRDRSASPR